MFFNRSETFWGPDSRQFNPERWLSDLQYPAKDIHGHRHLYTFADGPRICLGRGFALAEFKVLSRYDDARAVSHERSTGGAFGPDSEFLI
jgi:cytochrome P450